jgi:hypothetical protein
MSKAVAKVWPMAPTRSSWGFREGDTWRVHSGATITAHGSVTVYMPDRVQGKGSRTMCHACLECKKYFVWNTLDLYGRPRAINYKATRAFYERHQDCTRRTKTDDNIIDVVMVVKLNYIPQDYTPEFSPMELFALGSKG